jgi:CRISPR/Cas system-associated endonuclease Cas1
VTSTTTRCNSARTLYLGGATVKHVACSGAALVITAPNSSVRRYPVARLSRIVCSAHVNWQGAALALCMRSGIPIVWSDAHAQPLGICYSQQHRQQAFSQALELMLEGHVDGLGTHNAA